MEGYQYWVDELNANGGLLGREVELKVLDDGFDQQTAISDYNRLISQDKVDLLLGTFSSDLNLAVAPVAERFGYVYVEPSGGADEIFERNFKYLFFAQPATTQRLPNQFVGRDRGRCPRPSARRRSRSSSWTTRTPARLEEISSRSELGALGVETVYDETYAPDTVQLRRDRQLDQADANPDLVIQRRVGGDGSAAGPLAFQKVGFSPEDAPTRQTRRPTRRTPSRSARATPRASSPPSPTAARPPSRRNAEFVAGYTEQFGAAPTEDAANSYTAGQVLAAAVEAVGELDQAGSPTGCTRTPSTRSSGR